MGTKASKPKLTYTQYRAAIRIVAGLMALPGTPGKHSKSFGEMATDFETNGKGWIATADAAAPAKKLAKKPGKAKAAAGE